VKLDWRSLVGEPNVCGGGHLAAVVFCCDPRVKRCPFRDYALKALGVSKEKFTEVKDRLGVEAPGTCFGNLAYCCSPEKQCPKRDKVLDGLDWSYSRYLQYKWQLLLELVPRESLERAFEERVLKQYGMELLELDTRTVFRAVGYGNVAMKAVWIQDVIDSSSLADEELGRELGEAEFVGARIPRRILQDIDELVGRGVFKSRSQAIRSGLMLLLKAYRPGGGAEGESTAVENGG